jgi:uncharacterized protein
MALLVLDTNVWLDLLHFRDPRCAALRAALQHGAVRVAMRTDCRDEWQRVLGYPTLALDSTERQRLLADFDALSTACPALPSDRPAMLPRCADADDQKFLELARDAGASALLSRDRALLCLSRRMQRRGLCPVLMPEDWQLAESLC